MQSSGRKREKIGYNSLYIGRIARASSRQYSFCQ